MGGPRAAPVAQALVPAVSRLVSTRVALASVPRSGDAAGMSACATVGSTASFQHLAERFGGVALLVPGHLLGSAGDHDAAAVLAAVGPQVDRKSTRLNS